jgi:uncharacterized lipoprotein NlpE involved in copper resistance
MLSRQVAMTYILAVVVLGCERADPVAPSGVSNEPSVATEESASLLAEYAGVLPCADCAGIRTELRLYAEQPSGQAVRYELTETYLGTRDGDRMFEREGRWTVMRGSPVRAEAASWSRVAGQCRSGRSDLDGEGADSVDQCAAQKCGGFPGSKT